MDEMDAEFTHWSPESLRIAEETLVAQVEAWRREGEVTMDDEGWEQRMADRARARAEVRRQAEIDAYNPEFKSPEDVWAAYPDECRECHEPRLVHNDHPYQGWTLWMVCDFRTCPHAHHEGEILLAGAS